MPRTKKAVKRSVLKLKVKKTQSKKQQRVRHSKSQRKTKLTIKKKILSKRNSRRNKRRQRGGSVNPIQFSTYPLSEDLSAPNGEIVDTSAMSPEQINEANANMLQQKGGFGRDMFPQPLLDLGDMAKNSIVRSYNMYMGETSPDSLYSAADVQPSLSKVPDYDFAPNDVAAKIANSNYGAAAYSPANSN